MFEASMNTSLRPGWRHLSRETPANAFIHEWRPRECPRSTGLVYRLDGGLWFWRVSFWDDPQFDKRDGAPTDTPEEAMEMVERTIFGSGATID